MLHSLSIFKFWFTFLLRFHFESTCHILGTLYVQLFCWHTWSNCNVHFIFHICMFFCIFVEYLHNKVLISCFCGSFGINSLLILTNFPYKSNSDIQWSCQSPLKLYITDLYAYCIFVESLCYKVLIFCFSGPFGRNILFI